MGPPMPSRVLVWAGVLSLAAIALLPGVSTAASSTERQATAQIWVWVDVYASKYGIPLTLARNLVRLESGGRQKAVSPRGARGVMQLMPETARALGVNINDPKQNIEGGMRYLRSFYNRFGRWDLAVAAYNTGPQAVIRYNGVPPYPETRRFVAAVLGRPVAATPLQVASASGSAGDQRQLRRAVQGPESGPSLGSLASGFRWPVQGMVISGFGWRGHHHHDGIDISGDPGTPIQAAKAGRVTFAGWYYGYGLMVTINHGGGQETRYGHASTLLVRPDQVVEAGQIIARVGCTGSCTAPHVHFEIRIDGQAINPLGPLAAADARALGASPTGGTVGWRQELDAVQVEHEHSTTNQYWVLGSIEGEDDDDSD